MIQPRYMLDTDTVIYIRDGRIPKSRLDPLHAGIAVMSVISHGELLFGARKGNRKHSLSVLQLITALIPPIAMELDVAEVYGEVRASLSARGTPIGNNDTWIAAHALSAKLTLVTNNEREFRRVKGLKIENWVA